jgi:hypothetical protein
MKSQIMTPSARNYTVCNEIFLQSFINSPWYSTTSTLESQVQFPGQANQFFLLLLLLLLLSQSPNLPHKQPLKSLKFSPLKELLREKECLDAFRLWRRHGLFPFTCGLGIIPVTSPQPRGIIIPIVSENLPFKVKRKALPMPSGQNDWYSQ